MFRSFPMRCRTCFRALSGVRADAETKTGDHAPIVQATLSSWIAQGQIPAHVASGASGNVRDVEAHTYWPSMGFGVADVNSPKRWCQVGGCRRISGQQTNSEQATAVWTVDFRVPFVDLDAVWRLNQKANVIKATTIQGDTKGAHWTWQQMAAENQAAAPWRFAVTPRLEQSGYIPRKLIEAQPRLRTAMALGLSYYQGIALTSSARRRLSSATN